MTSIEKLSDELDNQEIHIRRLARRIDALRGQGSTVEATMSRELDDALGTATSLEAWDGDPPPGWPDPVTVIVARVGAQRRAIEKLAAEVEASGAEALQISIQNDLRQGLERMPFVLDAQLAGGPMVVPPDALKRDFWELVFHPQQEALLMVDEVLDSIEKKYGN